MKIPKTINKDPIIKKTVLFEVMIKIDYLNAYKIQLIIL